MSWRDPKYRYHAAASHADPLAFARRQAQRRREAVGAVTKAAQQQAEADRERAAKVRPIDRKRAAG